MTILRISLNLILRPPHQHRTLKHSAISNSRATRRYDPGPDQTQVTTRMPVRVSKLLLPGQTLPHLLHQL